MTGRQAPPRSVLVAYGVDDVDVEPLPGGQGQAWRAGAVVLKPLELTAAEVDWQAELFERVSFEGVRVPFVVRALDGRTTVEGWAAWKHVEGTHVERRWTDKVAAGEAFHRALADVPRPDALLDARGDPWAIGDRVAWGEVPLEDWLHVKHLSRLGEALRPIDAPSQLIHGDLASNILFADEMPPAVIDFSPYYRPPAFASAVIVGDALLWEDADADILDAAAYIDDFPQYLVRALIYRAVTDRIFRADEPLRRDEGDHYLGAVEFAVGLAR